MFKNRKKKGFTLVELIIVIAIIGILVAIAVPRFADATQGAKNRKIDSAARAIASAMSQHYANHLVYPDVTKDAEKKSVLEAAGLDFNTQKELWTFAKPANSSDKITVTYTWKKIEDTYTGNIPNVTTVTGSGTNAGNVVYKF